MTRSLLMILMIAVALVAVLRVPRGRWRLSGVLALSIALALMVEVTGLGLVRSGSTNNVLYNTAATLEFLLLLRVVHLFRPRWRTSLLVAAMLGVLAMGICAMLYNASAFLLIEGILILAVILCITLMAALWSLANTSEERLHHVPEFWLFMGLLIYFGGMIPVIGMIRFVFQQDQQLAARLYVIMPYLCIARYAFTAWACLLARRTTNGPHG